MFSHLPSPFNALITGTGGLGVAFANALLESDSLGSLTLASRSPAEGVTADDRVTEITTDLSSEEGQRELAGQLPDHVHLWLHTVGVLHSDTISPEKRLEHLTTDQLTESFRINTATFGGLLGQLAPRISRQPALIGVLSARIGSIGDNRLGGWYGYRASKAALNMLVKTASVELERRNPEAIIVSLHPGTTDTGLSKPFQGHVPDNKLFTPSYAADALLTVLANRTPDDSGSFWDWNDTPIEW
ncbi:SDR family NAD(P)-dependent oxidoreductase [Larsenimonas salina]|uniref:SDR family NAD(P)-dependent oxidoreductase n=1 Tax=Larsenimonas salina TaxID=1295565 RepID=UPI002072F80B|nr:SDR family NAD(P)-dependent oxidoreductase [Larsenimonas salina]MCM5703798.1 SDR family NAD(P)-dependent oxidoreductase [Larsenimonas salina]